MFFMTHKQPTTLSVGFDTSILKYISDKRFNFSIFPNNKQK